MKTVTDVISGKAKAQRQAGKAEPEGKVIAIKLPCNNTIPTHTHALIYITCMDSRGMHVFALLHVYTRLHEPLTTY